MAKRNLVLVRDEAIEGVRFTRGQALASIDDKGVIGDVVKPLNRGNIESRIRLKRLVGDDTDEGKEAAEAHAKAVAEAEKKKKAAEKAAGEKGGKKGE